MSESDQLLRGDNGPSVDVRLHRQGSSVDVRVNAFRDMRGSNANASKIGLLLVYLLMVPQIAVITWALLTHGNYPPCDASLKIWLIVHAARLGLVLIIRTTMVLAASWHNDPLLCVGDTWKNAMQGFAFVWFVMGNIYVFQSKTCATLQPVLYKVTFALVILEYVLFCLPVLLCCIMVPLLCFCLPCVMRVLAYIADKERGAKADQIATLPTVIYSTGMYCDDDSVCAICLVAYSQGDVLRMLHNRHHFHKDCVDEWLKLNATCPTCRASPFPPAEGEERPNSAVQEDDDYFLPV